MPGTIVATDFANQVLSRLNDVSVGVSVTGQLASGNSATPTISTQTTINAYATEAVAILCRTVWPLVKSFTVTPLVATRYVNYADISIGSPSYACWQALQGNPSWTTAGTPSVTAPLDYCSQEVLAVRYPGYNNFAPGVPTMWQRQGAQGLSLFVAAGANSGTLSFDGLAIAPAAQVSGAMFPDIPDDILISTVLPYVCAMLSLRNLDDQVLAGRAPIWYAQFEAERRQLYDRLGYQMRAYFPVFAPINPQVTPSAVAASEDA